jgi:hypothetical protein
MSNTDPAKKLGVNSGVPIKCETKRNQRNKTKPTKAKRNQRKQNEID